MLLPSRNVGEKMRIKPWLIHVAVVLGTTSLLLLALLALGNQFLKAGLRSLAESARDLEQAEARTQQLKERERQLHERLRQNDQLFNDLIDQRCGLREAASRWRAAHGEVPVDIVNRLYDWGTTEEERIILHLFDLVGQRLEKQPMVCAEVLVRLRREKALLEAENDRTIPREHLGGPRS
jgi:hypothetical protein